MEEILTLNEIASYLKVCHQTIRNMIKDKTIPTHQIGRQWKFYKSEIDKWDINQTSMKEKE